ncbi:uncharacterized protein LOC127009837 [Eriocheir sinensis]|uniref:uncharacterized protein LOC127009837 n=1 Tax=Eriocheir sinensis TaxID=95602 RepID=UPI0021C7C05F|nr:uncharacterized protein LOC127009837 [Eriocheir sinensis]
MLSSPYSFFLTEDSGQLGAQVRKVMVVFSDEEVTQWEFLKKVADGTYGFIDTASSAIGRSGQYEKVGKPCLFHIGRNPVRMDLDAFAYPKNSPVKQQFDEVMRWLQYFGIIEHLKSQYYSKACGFSLTTEGPKPISLNQAQGAFYVLGVGLTAALATLMLEATLSLTWCTA